LQLGNPLNKGFDDDLICVDDAPDVRKFGNLELQIVGPTAAFSARQPSLPAAPRICRSAA
jgi:hypothetical protein